MSGESTIVVCDDHEIVRKALVDRLERMEDLTVIGEAEDGDGLLAKIDGEAPDLVVIDIELPGGTDGLNLTVDLLASSPGIRVLILSAHDGADLVEEAREVGARGFLSKGATTEDLEKAVREILSGGQWFPKSGDRPTGEVERILRLTAREREVLDRVGDGLKAEQVARQLGIEKATVYTHVRNAITKLGVSGRAQAIALVTRYRYLDSERFRD